jgi:transposase
MVFTNNYYYNIGDYKMSNYIGIDIGKFNLDVWINNQTLKLANNKAGFNKLDKLLQKQEITLVCCEASGGYEKNVMAYLNNHGYPTHVAHANKVKAFAKSKGILVKTDSIDSYIISEYSRVMNIQPIQNLHTEETLKLKDLLLRREQLLADKQAENNRLDKCNDSYIKHSINQHIKWLEKELEHVDNLLKEQSQLALVKQKYELLLSIPSIGNITAYYLISFLPELGILDHKKIAALAGVAPFNRDSGTFRGKRFIQGGRKDLRCAIYMAAISSVKHNPVTKDFYQRLRANGKPAKVALTAVMRKMLTIANSVVKRQTPWTENLVN